MVYMSYIPCCALRLAILLCLLIVFFVVQISSGKKIVLKVLQNSHQNTSGGVSLLIKSWDKYLQLY